MSRLFRKERQDIFREASFSISRLSTYVDHVRDTWSGTFSSSVYCIHTQIDNATRNTGEEYRFANICHVIQELYVSEQNIFKQSILPYWISFDIYIYIYLGIRKDFWYKFSIKKRKSFFFFFHLVKEWQFRKLLLLCKSDSFVNKINYCTVCLIFD